MKKVYVIFFTAVALFFVSSCKTPPVWSRVEEHDLGPTSDESEIVDDMIDDWPKDDYEQNYYPYEDYSQNGYNDSRNSYNQPPYNDINNSTNNNRNDGQRDRNNENEKITEYLKDILAAMTTPDNKKDDNNFVADNEYSPPEQFPPIDEPHINDMFAQAKDDFDNKNDIEIKNKTTSPNLQRQSYNQDAWPRPGYVVEVNEKEKTSRESEQAELARAENNTKEELPVESEKLALEDVFLPYDELPIPESGQYTGAIAQTENTGNSLTPVSELPTVKEADSMFSGTNVSAVPTNIYETTQPSTAQQIAQATGVQQTDQAPVRNQTSAQAQQTPNANTQTTVPTQPATQTAMAPTQANTAQQPQVQTQTTAQATPQTNTTRTTAAPAQTGMTQQANATTRQTTAAPAQPNSITTPMPAQTGTTQRTPTPAVNSAPQQATARTQTPQIAVNGNINTNAVPQNPLQIYQYAPESPAQQEAPAEEQTNSQQPSRSVTVDLGGYLDVTYPGRGWIYLGENDSSNNLQFLGRKLGDTDTSFTLRARNSGKSLLHFYKNDLLTGKYIDDWLEVTVTDKHVANSSIHVLAPSYAEVVPPRPTRQVANTTARDPSAQRQEPQQTATAQTENRNTTIQSAQPQETRQTENGGRTVIQTTAASQPETVQRQNEQEIIPQPQSTVASTIGQVNMNNADAMLEHAKQLYNSGNHAEALDILHNFFDMAKDKIDEGLFLQGQILESNSSVRDIRAAIDSYQILMNNWPNSTLWQDAQRRYIYLRRFYINIQ